MTGQGWRAIFFQSGFEHSLMSHAGSGWARSPWKAVQQAALDVLFKVEGGDVTPVSKAASCGFAHNCGARMARRVDGD